MRVLAEERVGPYVRALGAALEALAPNDPFVPLAEATAHLHALDPVCSGDLLAPAEITARTGMPAFAWMERARSEAVLARRRTEDDDPGDARIEEVMALDRVLGARMRDRRSLHAHLREAPLLPVTRLRAAVRRLEPATDLAVTYDRLAPDGRWVRICCDVRAPAPSRRAGPLHVDDKGQLRIEDDRLQHLLTRHFATTLLALRSQLEQGTGGEVRRLSRGWLGPFWFPGVELPEGVPASLNSGLLLHASLEVVATDVHAPKHLDPLVQVPEGESPPAGQHIFRERRLAASAGVEAAARGWAEDCGVRLAVVPVTARRARRTL